MARRFKTVDYEQSGKQTVTIDDCLPVNHLARFIVAIIALLDSSAFYAHYAPVGDEPTGYSRTRLTSLILSTVHSPRGQPSLLFVL
jgi:hypothetical protein